MKLLDLLARLCAILAGLLLIAITLMTCASLIGRNTTGWTIVGDFELTGFAAGAAIALFLPICQLRRANIIVDFFTVKASDATRERLDRFGAAMLAAAMGLLAWRTVLGGLDAWRTQSESMMLGFPEWIVYIGLIPPLCLTALIGVVQALRGFEIGKPGMSPIELSILIFGCMLALMAIRTPIAIAMFAAGTVGYVAQAGWSPLFSFLNTQAFARFSSYDLSVIPLFILMGNFATQGGISRALFQFAAALMGRFRGGLAMGAVVASGAFGAICGSSVATAATITSVALPEMRRHGYSGRLATGTLAAGGTLGILVPPSVPLVIYAILAEQNIAKLFAAAMVPALLAVLGYVCAIAIYVRLVPGHAPEHDEAPPLTWHSVSGVVPIATIFLIVFGGIYGGLFTPTEGAAVGAAATFVAALLRREITWNGFKECFYGTAQASAMIFMIFLGADLMNASLALTQVPNQLAAAVQGWGLPPLAVVAGIVLMYIALGAIMDELSVILLTVPILFPLVMGLDLGMPREAVAIWFGILLLMTVGFGLLSPPVGLNVYVVNSMAKDVPIVESYHGVLPFLASDALRTLLLLFYPPISLWLVGVIYA